MVFIMLGVLLISGIPQNVTATESSETSSSSETENTQEQKSSAEENTDESSDNKEQKTSAATKKTTEQKTTEKKTTEQKKTEQTTSRNNSKLSNYVTSKNNQNTTTESESGASFERPSVSNRVEQVKVELPFVNAYCYMGEADQMPESVRLQDEDLIFHEELGTEPVHYYVLVDESGSCDSIYMEEMKNSIKTMAEKMMPNDKITLLSISKSKGETEYEPLLDGVTKEKKEDIEATVSNLKREDNYTYLNETICMTADHIAEKEEKDERSIILVISDCKDDNNAQGGTESGTQNTLTNTGVPLYILALKNETSTYKNDNDITIFRELSEACGGYTETVEHGKLEQHMKYMMDNIQSVRVFQYYSEMEKTDAPCQFVMEHTNENRKEKLTRTIIPDTYDESYTNEANKIKALKAESGSDKNSIKITFNKPVVGADNEDNYEISCDLSDGKGKEDYTVKKVQIENVEETDKPLEEETVVVLTLDKQLYQGTYTIKFKDEITAKYGNPAGTKPESLEEDIFGEKMPSRIVQWMKQIGWIVVVVIIVFVVLLIIILTVFRKIRKKGGVVYVENEPVLIDNIEKKQHVRVEKGKSFFIKFIISGGGKECIEISSELKGSLIVGRSDLSDVFIDDSMMSRQHFAITDEEGVLYIQDLETTNGTMLNGVRLNGKRKLSKNDVISAGSLQIRIDW